MGELAKQLGIGGEHLVGNAFEFIAHFACRHELTNVINDLPLLFARKLLDFLDDFNGTHAIKLTSIRRASKPAQGHDNLFGFMICDIRLRIWFDDGHKSDRECLRQFRRQLAGGLARQFFRFQMEMFQFLAFAHEAGAVENHNQRTDNVQNGGGYRANVP